MTTTEEARVRMILLARRSELLGVDDAERREAQRLDAALERLRLGIYGACESCGAPLVPRPLTSALAATCCVTCETVLEARR